MNHCFLYYLDTLAMEKTMMHMNFQHSTPSKKLAVPAILELLLLVHRETSDDIALVSVSRTVSQAIDELTALRQTAMDVMCEMENMPGAINITPKHVDRRRLC
jgi:hypothetical protein